MIEGALAGTWKFDPIIYEWDDETDLPLGIVMTVKDGNGNVIAGEDGEGYPYPGWQCDIDAVSCYGYAGGSDGGGSSGGNGIANVLIGVIPIMVILAILLGSVQFIRGNKV